VRKTRQFDKKSFRLHDLSVIPAADAIGVAGIRINSASYAPSQAAWGGASGARRTMKTWLIFLKNSDCIGLMGKAPQFHHQIDHLPDGVVMPSVSTLPAYPAFGDQTTSLRIAALNWGP